MLGILIKPVQYENQRFNSVYKILIDWKVQIPIYNGWMLVAPIIYLYTYY